MLFFVCYVGYEYAMCNFTPNKLCYVMLCDQLLFHVSAVKNKIIGRHEIFN